MKIAHQKYPSGSIFWWATGALIEPGADVLDEGLAALLATEVPLDEFEEGLDVLARGHQVERVASAVVGEAGALRALLEEVEDFGFVVELAEEAPLDGAFAAAGVDTVVHFYFSLWCAVRKHCTPNLHICQY